MGEGFRIPSAHLGCHALDIWLFFVPLAAGSSCSVSWCRLTRTRNWDSSVRRFPDKFSFSWLLGSTADTVKTSIVEAFAKAQDFHLNVDR